MKLRFIITVCLSLMSLNALLVAMDKPTEVYVEDFTVYNFCNDGNAKALGDFFNNNRFSENFDAATQVSYDDIVFDDIQSVTSAWDDWSSYDDDQRAMLINIQDKDGNTPLHIACKHNHHECVKLLLQQQNIDVNVKNNKGQTPLFIACAEQANESAEYLLQREDVDVNVTCSLKYYSFETSPLYHACRHDNCKLVIQLLSRKDIDLTQRCFGAPFFMWIIEFAAKKSLKFILNTEPFRGYLHSMKDFALQACDGITDSNEIEDYEYFFREIIFFSSKEQINAVEAIRKRSLLMIYSQPGLNFVSIILERNDLDLTLIDENFCTALDYAFFKGNVEAIKHLFNYCVHDKETLYMLSNIINLRSDDTIYIDYIKEQKSNPKFFTLLFNRFSYLGIDSLNIAVEDDEVCTICLDELLKNENNKHSFIVKLSCGHLFGVKCLNEWFRNNETCPCCRAKNVLSYPGASKTIVGFPVFLGQTPLDLTDPLLTKRSPLQGIEDPENKRAKRS